MKISAITKEKIYTNRLLRLEYKKWKSWLHVQQPYYWNLKRLKPGKTLDIGCGIGRNLKNLSANSIGVDHNKYSIEQARLLGVLAYLPNDFKKTKHYKHSSFDSILLSHVLEHLTINAGLTLIQDYASLLKSGGQLIIFCPQEKGYASDSTHVTFLNSQTLQKIARQAGFKVTRATSFPFPSALGKIFKYNEFVIVAKYLDPDQAG